MRRHVMIKHEMDCSWAGHVQPFDSQETKVKEMTRAKAQQAHRPASVCVQVMTEPALDPADLLDTVELMDLQPVSTIDAIVGPDGRAFCDVSEGTSANFSAEVGVQKGTPTTRSVNTASQTSANDDLLAGLDAAAFAVRLSKNWEPGVADTASLYARQVDGHNLPSNNHLISHLT